LVRFMLYIVFIFFAIVFFVFFFFFFQAEDGIRDFHVTGVQTCALPIFDFIVRSIPAPLRPAAYRKINRSMRWKNVERQKREEGRSEERRVGKECRSRW